MSKKMEKILIPLIAIALGILLGCVILLVSGQDVGALFNGLIKSATGFDLSKPQNGLNLRYPGEFLVSSMPIILTGLAIGFAYRCGMFNIGAEGQVIVGSLVSCMVAILVPMPGMMAAADIWDYAVQYFTNRGGCRSICRGNSSAGSGKLLIA